MILYRKNPKIEGDMTLQQIPFDDDMIVFGEEFAMFADPMTFPGRPTKLVVVEYKDLSKSQKAALDHFQATRKPAPLRHLGVIKSDMFDVKETGEVELVSKGMNKFAEPEAPVPTVEDDPEHVEVQEDVDPDVEYKEVISTDLRDMFNKDELVDEFPGITEANSENVFEAFKTIEDLSEASNVDLKKAGIRSNFYSRVRGTAKEFLESMQEE